MGLKSVKAADCIHLAEQLSAVRHLLPTETPHVVLPG